MLFSSLLLFLTQASAQAAPVAPAGAEVRGEDATCLRAGRPPGGLARPPLPDRPAFVAPFEAGSGAEGPCEREEWGVLSGAELAEAVASSTRACLRSLWTFDEATRRVVSAANVAAVSVQLEREARGPLDPGRLEMLCLFVQIAFYHEFYEGLSYDEDTQALARAAVVTLGRRGEILLLNELAPLRWQWSISLDSCDATLECLLQVESLFTRVRAHPWLLEDRFEQLTIYNSLFTLRRQIWNSQGPLSPWLGAVSASLSREVGLLALRVDPAPERDYLASNALWALGYFALLEESRAREGRATLTRALDVRARRSGPWVWAVLALEYFFASTLDDGSVLDGAALRAAVRREALPHRHEFAGGELVFETPLSLERARALFAATREVHAHFFRKGTTLAAQPGDANPVLRLVVYGSSAEYESLQPLLFDSPGGSGGIYLEHLGTLCTFERTPAETRFTLEELLRHEYVHYLDGRYAVRGSFGEPGTLYEGGLIDSYTEGLAEFLTGSTRAAGVRTRAKLLATIPERSERWSIGRIVAATHADGFAFYPYAGLLLDFLDTSRPALLDALQQAVRADDAARVRAWKAARAGDALLQLDFDDWLDERSAQLAQGQPTFFEDVPTTLSPAGLRRAEEAELLALLVEALPGQPEGKLERAGGRFRYALRASLTARSDDPAAQRVELDGWLDQVLATLADRSPHFRAAVAWLGDLEHATAEVRATLVLEGPEGSPPARKRSGGGCVGSVGVPALGSGDFAPLFALAMLFAWSRLRRPVLATR